jgi:hypothetical protein
MGYGYCRFGCGEKTNEDYSIFLEEPNVMLLVCGMWRHYAEVHYVQPKKEIRDLVLGKPVSLKNLPKVEPLNSVPVLFVEKKPFGYDHKVGNSPDREFIDRMQELIDKKGRRLIYMG